MSDARGGFACADVERFADAFLDGEFAADDVATLERHLAACGECARRVRAAREFRTAVRAAPRPVAPSELRARIGAALDEEPVPISAARRRMWRRAAPAAAAAALLVLFGWSARRFSPVVDDAVARHQRDLPVEVKGDEAEVRAWFANKVDFAMRPPRLPPSARLVGARLANVRDRQAGYLVYDVNGARVSVLVFDPSDLPMEARHRRLVGNHEVYLDARRGYHVAVYRDRDIGYALTSDLDEDQMIQLVSSAVSR